MRAVVVAQRRLWLREPDAGVELRQSLIDLAAVAELIAADLPTPKRRPPPAGREQAPFLPVTPSRLHHEPDDHGGHDNAGQHHECDGKFHQAPFRQVVPSRESVAMQNLVLLRSLRLCAGDNCR